MNYLQPPDVSVDRIFQEEDVIETKRIMNNRPTADRELKVKGYSEKTLFQRAKNKVLKTSENTTVLKKEIRDRLSKNKFKPSNNAHNYASHHLAKGPPKPECILPLRPVDTQAEVFQMTTNADAKDSVMSPYKGSLIDELNEIEEQENLLNLKVIPRGTAKKGLRK